MLPQKKNLLPNDNENKSYLKNIFINIYRLIIIFINIFMILVFIEIIFLYYLIKLIFEIKEN